MTDGPAAIDQAAPATLEDLLRSAEECAVQAQLAASMTDPAYDGAAGVHAQRLGLVAGSSATAWAEASQAWSALAVARMRSGAKLDEEPKDPRAALRQRATAARPGR